MIPENSMKYNEKVVPAGPALRDASGAEHMKHGGCFPFKVAEEGVMVRVQDSEASWEQDKTSILNHITQSDDPLGQPPMEHEAYDALNSTVRGLFRGAALYSYAMHGNTEKLRELLSEGTEKIDYQEPDGETPAFKAASQGHVDCLRLLAEGEANLDLPNKAGYTPALMAVFKGHSDCLRILAEHRANLDVPNHENATPIFMAVQDNHKDCVQILIDHKVDVNQRVVQGTPLDLARHMVHSAVVEMLLAAGAE